MKGDPMLAPFVFVQTLIALTVDRLQARVDRNERGQTAAEYLGIIVVVAAIVAAIVGSGIGAKILGAINNQIDKIAGN